LKETQRSKAHEQHQDQMADKTIGWPVVQAAFEWIASFIVAQTATTKITSSLI